MYDGLAICPLNPAEVFEARASRRLTNPSTVMKGGEVMIAATLPMSSVVCIIVELKVVSYVYERLPGYEIVRPDLGFLCNWYVRLG